MGTRLYLKPTPTGYVIIVDQHPCVPIGTLLLVQMYLLYFYTIFDVVEGVPYSYHSELRNFTRGLPNPNRYYRALGHYPGY